MQNGWSWKAPLEVIWSNTPDQLSPPRRDYPGWCSCPACLSGQPYSFYRTCFLMFRLNQLFDVMDNDRIVDNGCQRVSSDSYSLLLNTEVHWTLLKRAWPHFLHTLPSGICTHGEDPPSILLTRIASPALSLPCWGAGWSLYFFQYVHVFLVLGNPEMNTVLQLWPHKSWQSLVAVTEYCFSNGTQTPNCLTAWKAILVSKTAMSGTHVSQRDTFPYYRVLKDKRNHFRVMKRNNTASESRLETRASMIYKWFTNRYLI